MKEKQNQAIWLKKLKREIKDALKDLKGYRMRGTDLAL